MITYATIQAAENELNCFVKNVCQRYKLRVGSVFEPFELTASEDEMLKRLREILESAKREHYKRHHAREHCPTCGGTGLVKPVASGSN